MPSPLYGSAPFRQALSARPALGRRYLGTQQGVRGGRDDDLPRRGAGATARALRPGSGLGRNGDNHGGHERPIGNLAARH